DAGGYAKEASAEFLQKQKETIFKHVTEADIVITTALVPGKKAPILVTEEMVKNMRAGSVVLDMATEFGGNCEISEKGKTVKKYGVTIIGESNLPSLVPTHSSEMYARNILNLILHIGKEGKVTINLDDEIIKGSLITLHGIIINQRIKDLIK
ncbi:MAG TPA: NAD(P)(+) transhydrogenase (Re/Si-specific) subunit alpha, partial [Ignavibacteriaceae bacterium]|nr:NAD(P)(+) transhydrogenase (Re/Si-specific) subunit alpha [Ignavibacteriaceae bacterium]